MKKLYLLILLPIIFLNSCKKDSSTALSIVGEWELRTAISGSTGAYTNYPFGNGTILKFTKSNYERYSTGSLIKSGSYSIVKDVSVFSKEIFDRILYDNEYNSVKFFLKIDSNNKLDIWADGFDAPALIYQEK